MYDTLIAEERATRLQQALFFKHRELTELQEAYKHLEEKNKQLEEEVEKLKKKPVRKKRASKKTTIKEEK
jgi:hypothetical protein